MRKNWSIPLLIGAMALLSSCRSKTISQPEPVPFPDSAVETSYEALTDIRPLIGVAFDRGSAAYYLPGLYGFIPSLSVRYAF